MTTRSIITFGVAVTLLGPWASAQVSQQAKLVGSGSAGYVEQGISVALSADGTTALVGGWADNGGSGAGWVFVRTKGVWTQQGSKLVAADAIGLAHLGGSAALSADGNTAVLGGQGDNLNRGAAWVFVRSGGAWSRQAKLAVASAGTNAAVGFSVAVSGDGNTALVGVPFDQTYPGAVWVFVRSGGAWSAEAQLVGSGVDANPFGGAHQGTSVALSADGNTALVGGPTDADSVGAAWVFVRNGGTWSQQGAKLVGSGAVGASHQGNGVALSGDGNTAVVGGPNDDWLTHSGAAWVFVRNGGTWSQQGSKLVGTNAYRAEQGLAVACAFDGSTVIVGGPSDDFYDGGAWMFFRRARAWSQMGPKLLGTGVVIKARQGSAVALSADGTTALLGGPIDDGHLGAAWVFSVALPVPPIPVASLAGLAFLVLFVAVLGVFRLVR